MKDIIATLIVGAFILVIVGVLVVGSMAFNRHAAPYNEETRRLTFDQSRARQSGINKTIQEYCLNMRTTDNDAQKKAFAQFIVTESQSLTFKKTSATEKCVAEAKEIF